MKIKYICGAFLILSWMSCSKDLSYESNQGHGGATSGANFTAVINGAPWAAVDSLQSATIVQGFINISGLSSDNKLINITLNGSTAGTYALNQNTLSVISYVDGNSSNTNAFTTNQGADTTQSGGQVIVTSINTTNKTISGTFQCKVFREQDNAQEIITQGVFNNIPYATSLPPAPLNDTFNVYIADTLWKAPSISGVVASGNLEIIGTSQDGSKSVALFMPQNVGAGTYNMNFNVGTYLGVYIPSPGVTLISDPTGTLTITSNDATARRVRGTFQFTAVDLSGVAPAVQLTQGFFSVGY